MSPLRVDRGIRIDRGHYVHHFDVYPMYYLMLMYIILMYVISHYNKKLLEQIFMQ